MFALVASSLSAQETNIAPDIRVAPKVEMDNSDLVTISSREAELRRKEEELLRSMSFQPTGADMPRVEKGNTQIDVQGNVQGNAQRNIQRNVQGAEQSVDQAADISVTAKSEERALSNQSSSESNESSLKSLERHPALARPEKTQSAPNYRSSERIKTHSDQSFPDGTTAGRLGTFKRVDRDRSSLPNPIPSHSSPRIVPLHSITSTPPVKQAAFSFEEIATIKGNGTRLKTGPTKLDSTVLHLPQYSEVKIDYRSGSWYRVKTNAGVRGWVQASSLLFDAGIAPQSTVRIGGVKGSIH